MRTASLPGSRSRSSRLILDARAKINLGLEVRGKRPDGYHEIRSLMQSIRLADRLEVTLLRRDALELRCPNSDLGEGDENLVLRAARLLRDRTGRRLGARIVLRKRIPIGAGLGGGSSDAAAALVALNRIWGLRLSRADLEGLAAEIGSDVAFFIRGGTQLAAGRGEKLTPWPGLPRLRVLLVDPSLFVSTASIYAASTIPLTEMGPLDRLQSCNLATPSAALTCIAGLRNDLEEVAARKHPRIGRILGRVRSCGRLIVRVSGTGSCLYVLGADRSARERIRGVCAAEACAVIETWTSGRGWISVGPRGAGSS